MRTAFFSLAAFSAAACAPASLCAQETTNFSMVGFDVDLSDADKYHAAISDVVANCDVIELEGDNIACMQQKDNGGQVWVGLRVDDGQSTIVTANPAFAGKSRFPVTVEGRVSEEQWEPFEYQLAVSFSDLEIPLVVELADPRDAAKFADADIRQTVILDLTGFVFEPMVFASAEDFAKAQTEAAPDMQLASDFFIPSGLIGETARPRARANFAGKVIEAELMTPKDGSDHWRILLEVIGGGTINVVFDGDAIGTAPEPGNVIVGDYWLSARVLEE